MHPNTIAVAVGYGRTKNLGKADIYEMSIYQLENGKIVEQWGFWDEINLKKQMTAKSNQLK